MYKEKFDKLVEQGVITQPEKDTIYKQMHLNNDGMFLGVFDMKIDYKYCIEGDIFNNDLCNFVIKYCSPPLGMESIDDTFKKYGMTYSGISDGWDWFRKGKMTQYALNNGHKPIEEATKEELWKMLAMSSMYWKGKYEEWYHKSEKKSNLLDSFIGNCEMKYFGYDEDGYTENTIYRIFKSIENILKEKFKK